MFNGNVIAKQKHIRGGKVAELFKMKLGKEVLSLEGCWSLASKSLA